MGSCDQFLRKRIGIQYFKKYSAEQHGVTTADPPIVPMKAMGMRTRSLLNQVLAVNAALVAVDRARRRAARADRRNDATAASGCC